MSVQLFLSEAFVSLALFALGVAGYVLSKHGKTFLFQRLIFQHGKAIDAVATPEDKVAPEEMSRSQSLMKKTTTQAKNAEARRRTKRQTRSKVQDEFIDMCVKHVSEALRAQEISDEQVNERDVAVSVGSDATMVETMEEIGAEKAECLVEMPCSRVSAPKVDEPFTEQQQPLSLETSSSTDVDFDDEGEGAEEGATTPETYEAAELSENVPQDADNSETDETLRAEDSSPVFAEAEGKQDLEHWEPTMAPSEIDGSDDGLPDFSIPPTPPYGDDDMLMPTYTLGGVSGVYDTPTSAQAFTDGHQFFEPVLSPDGQQLYTDGQQVFMLACLEVPPSDPSTPCVGTQSDSHASVDPMILISNTYGNDVEGDLWDVCWEDFIPEAFAPPANV